jgi:hypothetical protein
MLGSTSLLVDEFSLYPLFFSKSQQFFQWNAFLLLMLFVLYVPTRLTPLQKNRLVFELSNLENSVFLYRNQFICETGKVNLFNFDLQ